MHAAVEIVETFFRLTRPSGKSELEAATSRHVASWMGRPGRPRRYCLEQVCTGFLAGRTEESTPEETLLLIHRLVSLLPPEYQARLTGDERGKEAETAARC